MFTSSIPPISWTFSFLNWAWSFLSSPALEDLVTGFCTRRGTPFPPPVRALFAAEAALSFSSFLAASGFMVDVWFGGD